MPRYWENPKLVDGYAPFCKHMYHLLSSISCPSFAVAGFDSRAESATKTLPCITVRTTCLNTMPGTREAHFHLCATGPVHPHRFVRNFLEGARVEAAPITPDNQHLLLSEYQVNLPPAAMSRMA